MMVTLGCLTYNEVEFLPRLLRTAVASDAIDDIVVVDTGSTDGTVDLARGFGATVLHHPPVTSFSAARNYLINNVTGDWLLFLDADELPGTGMLEGIRDALRQDRVGFRAASLNRYNFFANGSFYLSTEVKLLRVASDIRYTGDVAERLNLPPADIWHSPLLLNHFGHSRCVRTRDAKAERYLRLMDWEMARDPGRAPGLSRAAALIERSLGRVAAARDRLAMAETASGMTAGVAFVSAHVERADRHRWPATASFAEAHRLDTANASYLNLLAVAKLCEGAVDEAVALLEQGVETWPHLPHFRLNLGLAHQARGDSRAALTLLDAVAEQHSGFRYEDPRGRLEFDPYRPLLSETIPGYAGLDYHRAYLRSFQWGDDHSGS